MKLESNRLIIRDAILDDASFYYELFNDPDWIAYISDKNLRSVEATRNFLKERLSDKSKMKGLGFFTVVDKSTNEAIGLSSAMLRDKATYVDVGYGFLPKGRGKGFAPEATTMMIQYIKEMFQQDKVCAFTVPENEKSQQLLLKLGFVFVGKQAVISEKEDCVYEFTF